MAEGWLKIFYRFLEWEWYGDTNMVRLFLHLLLRANYRPVKCRGETIPRGAVVTSVDKLHHETGLSTQQIRTCLKRLISTNEITSVATSRGHIITICNYDRYQDDFCDNNKPTNKPTNKPLTNDQQTTNKRITTCIEGKKEKREEYNIPTSGEVVVPEPSTEKIPFRQILDDWNQTCTGFTKVKVPTEARKSKIRSRVAEMGGTEKALPLLHSLFEKVAASPFLSGDNRNGWRASFDWLFMNGNNWVKVYEGQYDQVLPNPITPNPKNHATTTTVTTDADARRAECLESIAIDLAGYNDVEPDVAGLI